jgi:hypothetical protein
MWSPHNPIEVSNMQANEFLANANCILLLTSQRIMLLRSQRVMLDAELAAL